MTVSYFPPAELSLTIETASGELYRWDPASPDPADRPLDITFSSESGKGCAECTIIVNRPADANYADFALLNEARIYLPDGQCVYEGRFEGTPVGDVWTINVGGWWSHGAQEPFTDMIVDRDLAAWSSPNQARLFALLNGGYIPDKSYSATVNPGIAFNGEAASPIPNKSIAELQYTAPDDVEVSKVMYKGSEANLSNVGAASMVSANKPDMTGPTGLAALTLDSNLQTGVLSASGRYLVISAVATATHTPAAAAAFHRKYEEMAVYADTNVPLIERDDGLLGYAASDGIKYLAGKYAPKWDLSGVEETAYPIPQGVWREPTNVCAEIERMNGFHIWRLGVWPGRKLIFAPYDLSTTDWQVSDGIGGVSVEPTGDTTENIFNGMCVLYTGFDGVQRFLTPYQAEDLRDDAEWIAANQWGEKAWGQITISFPCTEDEAVFQGMLELADQNRAKRPSTITVPMHIQDIHGSWHPSSLVKADQTISVMNQHSPAPRRITKVSWANHQLNISTDNTISTLGVYNTRTTEALAAGGLI